MHFVNGMCALWIPCNLKFNLLEHILTTFYIQNRCYVFHCKYQRYAMYTIHTMEAKIQRFLFIFCKFQWDFSTFFSLSLPFFLFLSFSFSFFPFLSLSFPFFPFLSFSFPFFLTFQMQWFFRIFVPNFSADSKNKIFSSKKCSRKFYSYPTN